LLLGQKWKRIEDIKKLFLSFIAMGFLVAAIGWSKPVYTNESEYQAAYQKIDPYGESEEAKQIADRKFLELRQEYLTSRHSLVDFGYTIILLSLIGFLIARKGVKNIKGPAKRWQYVVLAFVASGSITISEEVLLYLGYIRGDYPHWSDTLMIGTMANFAFGLAYLIFLGVHLLFLGQNFQFNQPLVPMKASNNYWLALMAFCFAVTFFFEATRGLFPRVGALVFIIYFYLSLLSGRQKQMNSSIEPQASDS
jgi:hypothetical protein